ncbi:MAG: hypothetical protein JRJ84_10995 [Deltaproteobacteria bacterium]|nr:hypothetical protein [Deltaproteobacteria bacterium]
MNLDQTALDVDMLHEHIPTARPSELPAQVVIDDSEPSLDIPWVGIGAAPTDAYGWVGEVLEMMASAYTPVDFAGSSRMEQVEELFFRGLLTSGVLVASYWLASTYLAPGMF